MQKPTSTVNPLPCSNFLHAPANLTGTPRFTQKSRSLSVNRAHWLGRVTMSYNQGEKVAKKIAPTKTETRESMSGCSGGTVC